MFPVTGWPLTECLLYSDLCLNTKPFAKISFSQVYELAGEIAGLDKETVLLDVCCGTGTIGICLASKCKEVTDTVRIHIPRTPVPETFEYQIFSGGFFRF